MKKSKTQKTPTQKKSAAPKEVGDDLSGKPVLPEEFLVVGIGASAGGIQALKTFFENVPADSGMAYVVILHLSPDHESRLAEVLQHSAQIPVAQVTEKVKIEPNHVYVVPPNEHLEMFDGHIVVSANITIEDRRAPVDIFFRTLAESHHARAVAVVLSGTGADGSMGLKRVKERGGAVFVQNPREAEFGEMPRNSIATDLVDRILNVHEIPARIIGYKESLGTIEIVVEAEIRPEEQQLALREIFTQLRIRTGHDFSNYKRATVLRRIERRINVRQLEDLPAYAAYVRDNRDEATALLKDLLISVTNFFRDREAFQFLETDVLPKIFHGKRAEDTVRIWVAGCATGEEAYSMAMLCSERTVGVIDAPQVQIFASDIDEQAISTARDGFYTLNDAADVSPERMRRFFLKENGGYRVRRELREMVLFANHNVLKDPAFSHLDAVTCRNMLIYLNPTAQERVMETFHFALEPGGFLLLGNSETTDGASDLYATVSKEHHIYQSRHVSGHIAYPIADSLPRAFRFDKTNHAQSFRAPATKPLHQQKESETRPQERVSYGDLHLRLLEQYTPSVLINEQHDIVHISGSAARLLPMKAGEPTQNILKLIVPELRLELRTALYQAAEQQTNVEVKNLKIAGEETINIYVRPVAQGTDDTARGFVLVLLETVQEGAGDGGGENRQAVYSQADPIAGQLEEELVRAQSQLRQTVEQFEVQAEELKASNEEHQAMNEELRSAAEELETSKEELQSVNEELITVNQELKVKIEELSQSTGDFSNLINSTDIATLFLDRSFRVHTFTPAASRIFNLIPADAGRPIIDITHRLEENGLISDVETVLETLQTIEREARTSDGRTYLMRVLPYRSAEDRIGGVVATFLDISERKRAEDAVSESEERLQRAINIETVGVIFFNKDIEITDCNEAFVRMSGYTREELRAGRVSWEALTPTGFVEVSARAIEELNRGGITTPYEKEYIRKDGSRFWALFAAKRIGENEIVEFVTDITEQKRAEEAVRRSEARQTYLLKLGDALRLLSGPLEIQRTAMRVLGEHLQADRVLYSEIEPDDRHFVIADNYARGNVPKMIGRFPLSDYDNAQNSQRRGETLVLSDIRSAGKSDEHAAFLAAGVQALIGVPLHKDGRWVASLSVHQGSPRAWSPEDAALVGETAERTWAAVERARAEAALRESEEKYRTLFDSIDQGFCLLEVLFDADAKPFDYRFVEINEAFEQQSGLVNAVGKTILELVPNLEPQWAEQYGKVARSGEAIRFEADVVSMNYIFDIYAFPSGAPGRNLVAVLFTDITERKRHESNLAFLAEVSLDLGQLTNIGETMGPLCAKIGEHFKVARVVFAEIGEDETTSVIRHEWCQEHLPTLKEAAELKNLLVSKLESAQRDGDISYIKDVAAELRDAALTLTQLGIASLLGAPLVRDEKLHLYLGILHSEPRHWRKDEIGLMRELTARIRTRLERAHAEEALRLGEAQLQVLLDETPMGVYLLDADFRIAAVNPTALTVFGEIPDLIGRDFDEVIHRLWSKEYADEVVRLFRHTLETGEPYYTPERIEERLDLGVTEYYEWNITRIPLPDGRNGVVCYFRDVSAQVFARLEIAASEEKYRTLFESIDEGFCTIEVLFDDAGKAIDYLFIEANPAFERHLGVENAIGKRIREFAPTHEEFWFETYGQIAKTGEAKRFEHEASALGRIYDVYAFRIGEPTENLVAVIFNDISERKRQEAELAELNAQIKRQFEVFNTTLSTITDFAYTFDRAGRFIYANRRLCDLLEIPCEEIIGKNFFDLNYPNDLAAKLQQQIQEVFDTGEAVRDETLFTNPAGADGFYEYIFSPFIAADGSVEFVAGSTRDVTERRNAEEAVRESESRLRALVENLPGGAVFIVDKNLRYLVAEGEALAAAGFAPEDLVGRTIKEAMPPEFAAEYESLYRQTLVGEAFEHEHDAHGRAFVSRGVPLTDAAGEVYAVLAISYDITERKRAEEALAESETRLRLLIESASDYAIFTMSSDGLIDSWNTGAEKVFGWKETEVLGKPSAIIFTPEDREKGADKQEIETALRMGRAPDERFHIRRDGSRFYASGVMTLLKNDGGVVQGFAKIARDMTEQIAAEKAVRDKELLQKLVGAQEDERKRIARDLHDELGQQLTALRLKLDAAKKMCKEKEVCDKIDEIELIAKSLDHGVDFLAWELRPAALDDLGLVAALDKYVNQWSNHSGVTAELISSTLKKARFEPEVETNLYRIVQEALNNTHKHARAKGAEVMLERRDGVIVMLIEDNGVGFNPKDKKNLLKGIGLIGMKERAQLIGGTLEIESAPGRGTTVFVRVPAEGVKGGAPDEK